MRHFLDSWQFNNLFALLLCGIVILITIFSYDLFEKKNMIAAGTMALVGKIALICATLVMLRLFSLSDVLCWIILIYVVVQALTNGRYVTTHILIGAMLIKVAISGAIVVFVFYGFYKIFLGFGNMIFS